MSKWVRDHLLTAILAVTATAVIVALGITSFKLYRSLTQLENKVDTQGEQIDKNKDNIQKQQEPCAPEDVRYPERSPGCTGEQSNSAPSIPVGNASTDFFSFGGGGSSSDFSLQPAAPAQTQQEQGGMGGGSLSEEPDKPEQPPDPEPEPPIVQFCVDQVVDRVCVKL